MSSFTVNLNGRPEDLLREIGMSLNGLIRRLVGENGTKPLRSTFLKPENADVDWIRHHVVMQVSLALHMRPNEKRDVAAISYLVKQEYRKDIDQWIEDNREKLAELGFIRDDEVEGVKFDRFGRRIQG